MKKTTTIILAGLACAGASPAQDMFSYPDINAALPLRAAVCDVIEIGRAPTPRLFKDRRQENGKIPNRRKH